MTWEWCVGPEGLDNARQNLFDQDIDWLQVCWAECETYRKTLAQHNKELEAEGEEPITHPVCQDSYFDEEIYQKELEHSRTLPGDILADAIWEFASEQRDCSNGGHLAYMCPYACHHVTFEREANVCHTQ